jgi:poly(3-hydroxybutyrate) depolymerase
MDWSWTNTSLLAAGTKKAPIIKACRMDPRFSYYLYLPKGFKPENAAHYHLAAVIHGTTRNAEKLKNDFTEFADETGTLILAPLFPAGVIDREDIHNYKFIKFHDIRFDLILLDMIDEVREIFGITEEKFFLHGFSGGGQFSHRMLYIWPERLLAVSAGAPGRSTYLNDTEDWYSGTKNFAEQFGKQLDMGALKKIPVLLLIGGEDTEEVDYSGDASFDASSEKNGSNRLERIRSLCRNYTDHGLNVLFKEIPGIGHEGLKLSGYVKEFFKQVLEEINK